MSELAGNPAMSMPFDGYTNQLRYGRVEAGSMLESILGSDDGSADLLEKESGLGGTPDVGAQSASMVNTQNIRGAIMTGPSNEVAINGEPKTYAEPAWKQRFANLPTKTKEPSVQPGWLSVAEHNQENNLTTDLTIAEDMQAWEGFLYPKDNSWSANNPEFQDYEDFWRPITDIEDARQRRSDRAKEKLVGIGKTAVAVGAAAIFLVAGLKVADRSSGAADKNKKAGVLTAQPDFVGPTIDFSSLTSTTLAEIPTTTTTTLPETPPETVPETTTTTTTSTTVAAAEAKPAPKPRAELTGDKYVWMQEAGIAESDWEYVDFIMTKESTWRPWAVNEGGCIGLGQNCPDRYGNYWLDDIGEDWAEQPAKQLVRFEQYAVERYGSWRAAYNAWLRQGWW